MTQNHGSEERRSLIEAIKTPLGFYSLVILIVDASFMGLAVTSSGNERTVLVYAVMGIMVLLVLTVGGIAVWKPEALWGKRYLALEESFARALGEEIYTALDSYLSTLGDDERLEEVYGLLQQTIASSPYARSKYTRQFCQVLVETIIRRSNLIEKWKKRLASEAKDATQETHKQLFG
ncbi:MAG TPA: hypothetical protein VJG32_04185 [Anaerolineae bacterium]|nr:hypothetical protein [Anaerolineae bacterium]